MADWKAVSKAISRVEMWASTRVALMVDKLDVWKAVYSAACWVVSLVAMTVWQRVVSWAASKAALLDSSMAELKEPWKAGRWVASLVDASADLWVALWVDSMADERVS